MKKVIILIMGLFFALQVVQAQQLVQLSAVVTADDECTGTHGNISLVAWNSSSGCGSWTKAYVGPGTYTGGIVISSWAWFQASGHTSSMSNSLTWIECDGISERYTCPPNTSVPLHLTHSHHSIISQD